jgi:3-deoxy-7-phosphoheptulonate synthase
MLILFRTDASSTDEQRVVALIQELGLSAQSIAGLRRRAVAVLGNDGRVDGARFTALPGVEEIVPLTKPYRMVARDWRPDPTVIRLGSGLTVGGPELLIIAGPCSVESESQARATAEAVKRAGATAFRAGAFKPRTSPYAFQGLGLEGLEILERIRRDTGLAVVTEAMDDETIDRVAAVADLVQIGARNVQNYSLLKRAGRCGKPVLLKRGPTSSIAEWLMAAEYVLAEGNPDVILCERGVRGLDGSTRSVFDVNAIPTVKQLSHLPVLADPSHGTGRRSLVRPVARAAIAAGADGLLIEVHVAPDQALSDGAQSLYPEQFAVMMDEIRGIAAVLGRRVSEGVSAR